MLSQIKFTQVLWEICGYALGNTPINTPSPIEKIVQADGIAICFFIGFN